MSPRGTNFELERFSLFPITAGVVLLELEGRLAGAPVRSQAPRMLVEPAYGDRREHAPVEATTHEGRVRASFAVPMEDVDSSALALAVGGLLLDLPAPDPVAAADRTIALSREANILRHELIALEEEVAAGREAAAEHDAELERRELAIAEREAEAEQRATEREAAADHAAGERIAEAERAASERQAEFARAAAKRQGDLERETAELGRELAEVRTVAEERDAAAAAERARLADECDAARADAEAADARAAELERGSRTPTVVAPVAPVDQAVVARDVAAAARALEDGDTRHAAGSDRPAEDPTTAEHPAATTAERPADATTAERPSDAEAAPALRSPDDTGPIPLRRGPIRGGHGAPTSDSGVPGRDRQRASAAPGPPDTGPGLGSGPSTRTLALAALALAALLVIVAVLGFVL